MDPPFDGINGLGNMYEVVSSVDIALMVFFFLNMADNESIFNKSMAMQPELFPINAEEIHQIVLTQHGMK